jgi:two-component system response regulator FixJ
MNSSTVFIVDDDLAFGESLSLLIQSMGFAFERYTSADEFLQAFDPERPGCILLDVRMPLLSGLDLQERLSRFENCPPVVMLSGFAEVSSAVRAMRQGAVDFLQKNVGESELWEAINRAISIDSQRRQERARILDRKMRFDQLTAAERQVLDLLLTGASNKEIAAQLEVSLRTIEDRRSRIMRKTNSGTLPQLVALALDSMGDFRTAAADGPLAMN